MPRVKAADVRTIMVGSNLDDSAINRFIKTANVLIASRLSNEGYSESLLTEIELNLAAHFCCSADPQVSQETIGPATTIYHGKTGLGLDGSTYGQIVKTLDANGGLLKPPKTKIAVDLLMENY